MKNPLGIFSGLLCEIMFWGFCIGAAVTQAIVFVIALICLEVYGPALPELAYLIWGGLNVVLLFTAATLESK